MGELYSLDLGPYLEHHGILGQKWGVRRYQNADGSLTDAGKAKLEKYKASERRKADYDYGNQQMTYTNAALKQGRKAQKRINALKNKYGVSVEDPLISNDKKYRKYMNKGATYAGLAMVSKFKGEASRAAIDKLTFKDMQDEKKQKRMEVATTYITALGVNAAMTPITGVIAIPIGVNAAAESNKRERRVQKFEKESQHPGFSKDLTTAVTKGVKVERDKEGRVTSVATIGEPTDKKLKAVRNINKQVAKRGDYYY